MIIKLTEANSFVSSFADILASKNVISGDKVGVAMRVGKRWKLKACRVHYGFRHCDDCGDYSWVELSRFAGSKSAYFDNHLSGNYIVKVP
jgi:hypothetical protein